MAQSYCRPVQGHLAHCILDRSRHPEPEVRITRYAITVFTYAFCESCQFSAIYPRLHPLLYPHIHIKTVKADPQYQIPCMLRCHRSIHKWRRVAYTVHLSVIFKSLMSTRKLEIWPLHWCNVLQNARINEVQMHT